MFKYMYNIHTSIRFFDRMVSVSRLLTVNHRKSEENMSMEASWARIESMFSKVGAGNKKPARIIEALARFIWNKIRFVAMTNAFLVVTTPNSSTNWF